MIHIHDTYMIHDTGSYSMIVLSGTGTVPGFGYPVLYTVRYSTRVGYRVGSHGALVPGTVPVLAGTFIITVPGTVFGAQPTQK